MEKAYEVWGDGVETSIIRPGVIIRGNSPKDALKRYGIKVKRRLVGNDATPPKWIVVRRVIGGDFIRYAPGCPRNFYEV